MRTLGEPEYSEVWEAFNARFRFRPSVDGPFPAITEPQHSITYRLADEHDDPMVDEFVAAIRDSFRDCGLGSEELYYLDWQHECYACEANQIGTSWFTGYPDGDYAIFLTRDLSAGTFGHPWESSICLFGDRFVKAFLPRKPAILATEIRNVGRYGR